MTTASASASSPGAAATPQGAPAAPLADCTAGALPTRTAGVLTVATGPAPAAPWVVGDPADGQGLEAAVAAAVARGLGYTDAQVRWVTTDRSAATAGGTEAFDLDLDRFSAAELAAAPVDVSSGYFADADAVLVPTAATTPAEVAALVPLRLLEVAAADGSTVAVRDDGAVVTAATVADVTAATAALRDGSADGVVLPLTDALAVAAADPAVRVLGTLASSSSQPDQLVALLAPGSALTPCVSAVLDRLRVEGEVDRLAETWVPVTVLD
ncbi:hypothetical protein GCM10009818_36810 [Nakamurella flavida]